MEFIHPPDISRIIRTNILSINDERNINNIIDRIKKQSIDPRQKMQNRYPVYHIDRLSVDERGKPEIERTVGRLIKREIKSVCGIWTPAGCPREEEARKRAPRCRLN